MTLGVRTYIVMIVLSATCSSLNTDIFVEIGIMTAITLLQLISAKGSFMPKLLICYALMLFTQFVLFPLMPQTAVSLLSLPVVNIRSFFPTIMCIVLLYRNTKVSQMTAVFTRMHVPKGVTITLAVAVRYIPALKEEWIHIREAMKMRTVSAGVRDPFRRMYRRLECHLVPLFVSAINTSDELSAAAVTRGIDDPAVPTCRNYRPLGMRDYTALFITAAATAFCVWREYGGAA